MIRFDRLIMPSGYDPVPAIADSDTDLILIKLEVDKNMTIHDMGDLISILWKIKFVVSKG